MSEIGCSTVSDESISNNLNGPSSIITAREENTSTVMNVTDTQNDVLNDLILKDVEGIDTTVGNVTVPSTGESSETPDSANETRKGVSDKTNTIDDDLNKELFPLSISTKKRKDKAKQLKNEEFDTKASTRKQSGFTTQRPIRWALSLEKYLLGFDSSFRWHYKTNQKTKKYTESTTIITYNTKVIVVSIYFYTGIINVHGEYKWWVQEEFPKVQNIFKEEKEPDLGEMESHDGTVQELEALWVKHEELEAIIITHDDVMQKMMERAQAAELKVVEMEKSFDEKLTVFTKVVLEDCESKFEKLQKDVTIKVQAIYNKIDKMHTSLFNQIKDNKGKDESQVESKRVDEMHRQLDKIQGSIQQEVNSYINSGVIQESVTKIEGLISKTNSLESQVTSINNVFIQPTADQVQKESTEIAKLNSKICSLEAEITVLNNVQRPPEVTIPRAHATVSDKQKLDIIMCFDSNGKYLDRKKLWKVNNSEFKRCSDLFQVSQVVETCNATELKYFLIHVGCNDIDEKDHLQVFGELELLIEQIRAKFRGIKLVIGEITPRKDERDVEVIHFNNRLKSYAENNTDVFVAIHKNLRDPSWSMYSDDKHLHARKIGKYAANVIRALKEAYNITSKRDLFTSDEVSGTHRSNNEASSSSNAFTRQFTGTKEVTSEVFNRTPRDTWEAKGYRNYSMQDKLSRLANYDQKSWSAENGIDEISRLKQDLTKKLVDAIQNVLS